MRDFVCILSTYVCTQWFRRKLFFFIPFFAPIFIPTLFRIVSWTLRIAFFYIHIRAGCTRALFSRTAPFLLREDPRPEPSFGQICELPIWNLCKFAQADFPENLANFASHHTSILAKISALAGHFEVFFSSLIKLHYVHGLRDGPGSLCCK